MKALTTLVLALALSPALAQPGPSRPHGQGPHAQREFHRQMPRPERRMGSEERERLREQVRSGQMSREEARERWREERARRGMDHVRSPEERDRLRRDVLEANRDLPRR